MRLPLPVAVHGLKTVNIEMGSTAIEVNAKVVPAEERKKGKLCKEYLAYANSLTYPILF